MARVPYVSRDALHAKGQEIYDRIRRDRNAPEVGLQFRALLHNPQATSYLTSLGAQLCSAHSGRDARGRGSGAHVQLLHCSVSGAACAQAGNGEWTRVHTLKA